MKRWNELVSENMGMGLSVGEIRKLSRDLVRMGQETGAAGIMFRNGSSSSSPYAGYPWYAMNGTDDTWFRQTNKSTSSHGYGLAIKKLKVSGSPKPYGNGMIYKALMDYTNMEEEDEKSVPVWLFVHNQINLDDVEKYIEQYSRTWKV